MSIAVVDWILLAVLVFSMLMGAWRGLVYEVLSVLGWVVSFYAAHYFAPLVSGWLPMQSSADAVRYATAFVLVFVVAVFTAGLLASLLKKLTEAIGLRPIDRTMGAAFGLVRGAILLLAASVVVGMTDLKQSDWWQDSKGAPILTAALNGLKPVLPDQFTKYLN